MYLPNLWAMSRSYEIRSWSDHKSRCVYWRLDRVQSGIVVGWPEVITSLNRVSTVLTRICQCLIS